MKDLSVSYGAAQAVDAISFDVGVGEIAALIGANGAGKSSSGKAVAGLVRSRGTVVFDGRDISGMKPEARVRDGIVYVPEGRRVFSQLTVDENLRAGAFTRRRTEPWQERLEDIYERLPRLKERQRVRAALLSGGEQQLLAISRAIMAFPRLLILGEPSLGLAPVAVRDVHLFLEELMKRTELAILVLEQNISFTSRLAQRAWILDLGRLVMELDSRALQDPLAVRALLVQSEDGGARETARTNGDLTPEEAAGVGFDVDKAEE